MFQKGILISILIPVLLSGCDILDRFISTDAPPIRSYQTISSILTNTAAIPIPQKSPVISLSPINDLAKTFDPEKKTNSHSTGTPTLPDSCNSAIAGIPLDLTIPDNTVILAGANFSKTWRLVNNGTCPWSRGYAAVWFSGDALSSVREVFLNKQVDVGKSIDISIDMVAPGTPGVYQSNWKLRTATGTLFGIGPGGASPFWVKIIVQPGGEKTSTVQLPSPTPTVLPYSTSTTTLYLRNSIDLDKGGINPLEGFDLRITVDQRTGVSLTPQNGAKTGIFGTQQPLLSDCQLAFLSPEAISLNSEKENVFYCYLTDQGLPGMFVFKKVDTSRGIFELFYFTWYLP